MNRIRSPYALFAFSVAACLAGMPGCVQDSDDQSHPTGEEPPPPAAKAKPVPYAGRDTTVSVGDSVILRARAAPGVEVVRWEWDVGRTGNFVAVTGGDTIIRAGTEPGSFDNVLKAVGADGQYGLSAMQVDVVRNVPEADAGRDTTVTVSDTVRLRARARTRFGRIVKWEWNVGTGGSFVATSGDTDVVALDRFGLQERVLRVTDDDGNTGLDTIRVTIVDDFPTAALSIGQRAVLKGGGMLLQGRASDLGSIAKWEWDLGDGEFVPGGSDTAFRPAQAEGETVRVRVRATDDDGHASVASGSFVKTNWELYTPVDSLSADSNSTIDLFSYSMAQWKGKLFIAGFQSMLTRKADGNYASVDARNAFTYDFAARRWTREFPLPDRMMGNRIVALGDRLFSVGGRATNSPIGDGLLYEYIPAIEGWFPRQDLPKGLKSGTPLVQDGALYYFGFVETGPAQAWYIPPSDTRNLQVWRYQERTDTWDLENDYALSETGSWKIHGVVAMGPDAYLCASSRDAGLRMFRYDLAGKAWFPLPGMSQRYEYLAPVAIGTRIYLLGGDAGNNMYPGTKVNREIWKPVMLAYDVLSYQWKSLQPPLFHPHVLASPVALDGVIYDLSEDFALEAYTP